MDGTDKEGNEVLSEDEDEYDDEYGSEDDLEELNEEQLAALKERADNGELDGLEDDDEEYDDEDGEDGEEYDDEEEDDEEEDDAAGGKRPAPSNGDGGANKRSK